MEINGWKYYNHAVIPDCPINEPPQLQPVLDGSIWGLSKEKNAPIIARYTTEFDNKEETSFWYVIKDGPFVFDELSSKYKRSVKTALKRCEVKRVNPTQFIDELYEVYNYAYSKYQEADNRQDYNIFKNKCELSNDDWWIAIAADSQKIIGYIVCKNYPSYTETLVAKYHPQFQNYRQSDAIHYVILDYYLNVQKKSFVLSGARSVNHKTNVQDYEINNWKYRKAFCNLHILVNPKYKIVFSIAYAFRKMFILFDKIVRVHQLNGLFYMYGLRVKDE